MSSYAELSSAQHVVDIICFSGMVLRPSMNKIFTIFMFYASIAIFNKLRLFSPCSMRNVASMTDGATGRQVGNLVS